MRALVLFALLAALAACNSRTPQGDAEAAVPGLTGRYNAESDTAISLTGGVVIARDGLSFDKGAMLATHALGTRHGWEPIARNGDTFAAAAVGPGDMTVELRRIGSDMTLRRGESICGAQTPTYVAITYEAQRANVTLVVFAGDEQPGPDASASTVCGVFAYVAPTGARTQEGVVLR